MKSRKCKFKLGDTVVFDVSSFNPEYWDNLSEKDRKKYYGDLGYGDKALHRFIFICEHNPQTGHCVLISMRNQRVETMRHTNNFRLATEDEV